MPLCVLNARGHCCVPGVCARGEECVMRKFNVPARRFSAIALPFTSVFVQPRAAAPERAEAVPVTSDRRAGDGGQPHSNHGYATAAVRLSRTYW
jgi:hypothetical protein